MPPLALYQMENRTCLFKIAMGPQPHQVGKRRFSFGSSSSHSDFMFSLPENSTSSASFSASPSNSSVKRWLEFDDDDDLSSQSSLDKMISPSPSNRGKHKED